MVGSSENSLALFCAAFQSLQGTNAAEIYDEKIKIKENKIGGSNDDKTRTTLLLNIGGDKKLKIYCLNDTIAQEAAQINQEKDTTTAEDILRRKTDVIKKFIDAIESGDVLFREKINGKVHAFGTQKHAQITLISTRQRTTIPIDTTKCTQEDLKTCAETARTALNIVPAITTNITKTTKPTTSEQDQSEITVIATKTPPPHQVPTDSTSPDNQKEEEHEQEEKGKASSAASIMQEVKKAEKKAVQESAEKKADEQKKEETKENKKQEQRKEVTEGETKEVS